MSQEDTSSIVCRQCGEVIPLDAGNCPHCGKSIRGLLWSGLGVVFGLAIVGSTLLRPGELAAFGVIGFVIAATSAYFIYERRQRIQAAAERGGHTSEGTGIAESGADDESEELYS